MKAAKLLYQSGNFLLYTFKHSLFSESDILCKPCAVILTNFPGYLLDFCGCCCFSQIHRKQPLVWISRFLSGQCFQGSVPHFQNKGWWCLVLLLTNTFLCVCMIMMHTCVWGKERENGRDGEKDQICACHVELRGHLQTSTYTFCYVCRRVSVAHHCIYQVASTQAFQASISSVPLTIRALGLKTHAVVPGFPRALQLGIPTVMLYSDHLTQ